MIKTNIFVTFLGFLLLNILSADLHAQKDGYLNIMTIKQPYHTFNATKYQDTQEGFQKVNGIMISESQQYLVISYAYKPTHFAVYKIGTWEQIGVYKIMGPGVELYCSYFGDDDKSLYVKYDRYSTNYKVVEFKTGYIKKISCEKTPKGCYYEEVIQENKELTTKNRKYFFEISKFDASDILVYVKK